MTKPVTYKEKPVEHSHNPAVGITPVKYNDTGGKYTPTYMSNTVGKPFKHNKHKIQPKYLPNTAKMLSKTTILVKHTEPPVVVK